MSTSTKLSRPQTIISWIAQLIAALIMLQTLYFKLTGAPETIWIFTQIGQEPVGRYGSAAAELAAGILLLWPRHAVCGAILGLGVMSGALFFHLTSLGIQVEDGQGNADGGVLFGMAVLTWLACLLVVILRRRQIPVIGSKLP